MKILQFKNDGLAHFSYAIISDNEIALVDPSRNPKQYLDLIPTHEAKITAVIETHPHADFVSCHAEIAKATNAKIYTSKLSNPSYTYTGFDDGDTIKLGSSTLVAMNTPGHSPDSISILAKDENKKPIAVFSGDTLFIGNCGRPDLRKDAGNVTADRVHLAGLMYETLKNKFLPLPDDVLVYPAHGAGSLCGKGISKKNVSTMGDEKAHNWSLQPQSKESFIEQLTQNQPHIPKYFGYDVDLNLKGAPDLNSSVQAHCKLNTISEAADIEKLGETLIIDTRAGENFRNNHIKGSINLPNGNSFSTWLGSIVAPHEEFHLIVENETSKDELLQKIADIGYEPFIKSISTLQQGNAKVDEFSIDSFLPDTSIFTIIDVRNESETSDGLIFKDAINLPLYKLRETVDKIPQDKPILVHCAGGYRSIIGRSIVQNKINNKMPVYDLGTRIKQFI